MRYVSNHVISFSIKTKDRQESRRVNFTSNSNGGSSFTTDNLPLIEAMEASPMFNNIYERAPESVGEIVGKKPRKKKEEPKKKAVESVGDWQDAIEYLVTEFGCDASILGNPEAILTEAAKQGVEFPNLVNK